MTAGDENFNHVLSDQKLPVSQLASHELLMDPHFFFRFIAAVWNYEHCMYVLSRLELQVPLWMSHVYAVDESFSS